jgi:hypothetical protein
MRRFCWPGAIVFCLLLFVLAGLASLLGEVAAKGWVLVLFVLLALPVGAALRTAVKVRKSPSPTSPPL